MKGLRDVAQGTAGAARGQPVQRAQNGPRKDWFHWTRATGFLVARWGKDTGVREKATGQRRYSGKDHTTSPGEWEDEGRGE